MTEWTWTQRDAVDTITDATGVTRYTYHRRGPLDAITFPSGARLAYDWNLRDQLTAIEAQATPTGRVYRSTYVFDGESNLTQVIDPLSCANGAGTTAYHDTKPLQPTPREAVTKNILLAPGGTHSRYMVRAR